MYRTIILDFDGVLVESNTIKDKAFEVVFADYPRHMDTLLAYHRKTTLIRFEKFRYIVEQILKEPYSPKLQESLAHKFSQYCISEVSSCPWVKGAQEFLNFYEGRIPLYLVSINPMDDLQTILANRKMAHFFKGVYVAQDSKRIQLQEILKKEGLEAHEAVFIGDSVSDCISAQQAGIDFIGRRSTKGLDLDGVPVFDDLDGILHYLKEKYAGIPY